MTRGRRPALADGYNPKTGEWAEDTVGGRILAAVSAGNFLTHAAGYAGVTERALMKWMARGRHHIDQQPDNDTPDLRKIPKQDRMYVHFVRAITREQNNSVVELVTLFRHACQTDWRAADRLLGHIAPDQFQPRTRIEHTGPNGGPIRVGVTAVETALSPLLAEHRSKASTN